MTLAVFTALGDKIRSRFSTRIEFGGDGGAPIPTRYPNDNRDEPDTGTWARVTIREGEREQADIGAALVRSRTVGVLFVELFGDVNAGTKALSDLAGRVGSAFQRTDVAGVAFKTPTFNSGERSGTWWRVLVKIPFYFDDTDA